MIGNNFPTPTGTRNLSDDELEELYGEGVEATHKCQTCKSKRSLDDYQKHTPSWCYTCDSVKTFEKLPDE